MNFYPKKISRRFYAVERSGKPAQTNAAGTGASFLCGTFVRVFLDIDIHTKEIREAKFKSNGCGFAIAAADVLTEKIVGKKLTELHGLDKKDLQNEIETELGIFDAHRRIVWRSGLTLCKRRLPIFALFKSKNLRAKRL